MLVSSLLQGLQYITSFSAGVYLALFVVVVTIVWKYVSNSRSSTTEFASRQTENETIPEEDEDYLREVAKCAVILDNYSPKEEDYPDFLKPLSKQNIKLEEIDSGFVNTDLPRAFNARFEEKSNEGDSMLVNLPDNLEEEQEELDLCDLTADDISVGQETDTNSELSPQDMADIAEELNTSLMSVNSIDINELIAGDAPGTRSLTEESEYYKKFNVKENTNAKSNLENHDLVMDNVEFTASELTPSRGAKTEEKANCQKDEIPNFDQELDVPNATSEEEEEEENIDFLADRCSDLLLEEDSLASNNIQEIIPYTSTAENFSNVQKNNQQPFSCPFDAMASDGNSSSPPTRGNLNSNQHNYDEMISNMSTEDAELEKRTQNEQLSSILQMMRNTPETFGTLSEAELTDQLRLYCM